MINPYSSRRSWMRKAQTCWFPGRRSTNLKSWSSSPFPTNRARFWCKLWKMEWERRLLRSVPNKDWAVTFWKTQMHLTKILYTHTASINARENCFSLNFPKNSHCSEAAHEPGLVPSSSPHTRTHTRVRTHVQTHVHTRVHTHAHTHASTNTRTGFRIRSEK